MAVNGPRRRQYPGSFWFRQPGQAYARTSGWPSRYYQRKVSGSVVAALAGLNTTSDDFAKRDGESPYIWNARLTGTKETRKRAQSMSRMGQEFLCMPDGAEATHNAPEGKYKIAVGEDMSIRWNINVKNKLTQVGLFFSFDGTINYSNTNAHFVLILRNSSGKEVCRAIRKVSELVKHGAGTLEWFRFIRPQTGAVTLEATLVDDLDDDGNALGYVVYLRGTGYANHYYAEHELPNLDKSLREKAYQWKPGVSIPCTAYKDTDWETFPVWLQNGYFNAGGSRYTIIGVKHSNTIELFKVKTLDVDNNTGSYKNAQTLDCSQLIPPNTINPNATQVRMTQAGNHLYFVDGYSPLRKINLDDWTVSDARPNMNSVDTPGFTPNMYYYKNTIIVANGHFQRAKTDFEAGDSYKQDDWEQLDDGSSITAWAGASLIYFMNNRLFLSGFRHATVGINAPKAEPNLVIMSSIDSVTARYDMFNRELEFFYVPDRAPSSSSSSPVTAFSNIGDYLLIFTADGLYFEQVQAAVEFSGISQSTPEGSQYGVIKQEHVCKGRNNVYFLNPTMGVMRTAGSTATVMSSPVDSEIAKFGEGASEEVQARFEKIHLTMTDELLRMYYSPDNGNNSECLVDYATIPQHRSYWYRDNNTPIAYTTIDMGSDNYFGVHSDYPALVRLDSTLKDFDCAILYEYYTKYLGTPDRLDHCIVRRVHVTTLQTYQSSIFIGLDYDHNNSPIVWRKFVTPTIPGTFENEDIFGDDGESGATNLDIRILTDDTRFVQLRLKQYCYDFQAEILQLGFEYGNRTVL